MLPKGIVSTGWPAVRDTCLKLKITFDPWQDGAGRAILGKRKDGLYAADAVVISIPRQVGKTFLVGSIMFALCIITPHTTAIWTAHRFKTARETFDSMRAMALRPEMGPHVEKITTGAGDEAIHFRNGSRILFGARERGFGRGFSEVDILVLDEAQILTSNAMDDMVPATNQARNPLILLMGTPPRPSDPGEVFTMLRTEALSGESDGTLYIEFSADEDADPLDRKQWAKANPSYPQRTSARAILRMKKHLTDASFLREGLGVWDAIGQVGPFSAGAWGKCASNTEPPPVAALGLALDVDRVWLSLGASSAGEVPHLGSVKRVRLDIGLTEMLDETARIARENGVPVAIDAKGPAASLIDDLLDRGVSIERASLDDYVTACADLYDAVEAGGRVTHGNYDDLNAAAEAAGWRNVGDRRVWSRRAGDVSMLEAVTLAKWAADLGGVIMW